MSRQEVAAGTVAAVADTEVVAVTVVDMAASPEEAAVVAAVFPVGVAASQGVVGVVSPVAAISAEGVEVSQAVVDRA